MLTCQSPACLQLLLIPLLRTSRINLPGSAPFPLSPLTTLAHWPGIKKSLVSLLKLFLSPHLFRTNYFAAISVLFEPPSCKDGGSATGRNQWDKVGLLAMTAVFVYFFVCMPYDFVSRLQLQRQSAKNHHEAPVLSPQGPWARLWWSKVRLYGLSGISLSSTISMVFYIIPIICP